MNLSAAQITFRGKSPSTRDLRKANIRLTIRALTGRRGWETLFDDRVVREGMHTIRYFVAHVAQLHAVVTSEPGYESLTTRIAVSLEGYMNLERIRVEIPEIEHRVTVQEQAASC